MSRITDYLRERRIGALMNTTKAHLTAGRKDEARASYALARVECDARSSQQIARMERAQYMRLSPSDRKLFDRFKGGSDA